MSKRLAALFAMLFAVLVCLQTPALADGLPVAMIDVANTANGYYKADGSEGTSSDYCYKIEDARILLSKTDVVYELTGLTNKSVTIINSSKPTDAFNILLNGATLSDGINIQNSGYFTRVSVETAAGSSNTVNKLIARDLTIFGAGSVNAQYVGSSGGAGAKLHITDAKVTVNVPTNSNEFNGACVIDGSAEVRFIATKDYAPLQVENGGSLTLKDGAKLYCLHNNPNLASGSYVAGLEMFSANLRLEGNSYLEAEARPCINPDYNGDAIVSYGGVDVLDNAKVVARANGAGLNVGALTVSGEGARIDAESKAASGVAADSVTVENGGTIDASGSWQAIYSRGDFKAGAGAFVNLESGGCALWAEGNLVADGALIQAVPNNDVALFSKGDVDIKNSTIIARTESGDEAIRAWGDITADLSWLDLKSTSGEGVTGTITNSVVFNNNVGTVIGDAVTNVNNFIDRNASLTIPEGASLIVGDGLDLRNDGVVNVLGTFNVGNGTLTCLNHSGGLATCAAGPLCDLCQTEYGVPDPTNHAHLEHVEAKAATTEAEGNIEYWVCSGCSKYFADAAAREEIEQASTVLAKLPEQKPVGNNSGNGGGNDNGGDKKSQQAANKKGTKSQLPATGDALNAALPLAAALAGVIVIASGFVVSKR